jgi:hypothetical protein
MRGSDNKEIQKAFCNAALIDQKNEKVIKNKILFVHSMGNLILSAAIKNNFCDIDVNSTAWYMLQGPILGSEAAKYLINICNGNWEGMIK